MRRRRRVICRRICPRRSDANARSRFTSSPTAAIRSRARCTASSARASASASQRARLARGVVLLDPPRAGAGRQVVEDVAALDPRTVVYVACDPVALARDLGTFREAGYLTDRVDAFDLFPNSHHVEAVAVLRRG